MFLVGLPKQAKVALGKWRQPNIEVSCNEVASTGSIVPRSASKGAWATPRKKRPDDSRYCEYSEESAIKEADASSQKECDSGTCLETESQQRYRLRQRLHGDSGTCLARWLLGEGIQNTLVYDIKPNAPRLDRTNIVSKALTPRPKDSSSGCTCSSDNIYCSTCLKRVNAKPLEIPHSKAHAKARDKILLPYTGNLLCNWSPVDGAKIEALIKALTIHWQAKGDVSPPPQVFVDLGCGDGRVVHQVCRAFPGCRGIGVDLNAGLIEYAKTRATKLGISSLCNFIVQDLADVDLSEAGAVFLYVPKPSLTYVVSKVLPGANLPYGAGLFCAEDHLPGSSQYVSVNRHTEGMKLYCYEWRGSGNGGYCKSRNGDKLMYNHNSSSGQGNTKHPKPHNAVPPQPTYMPPQPDAPDAAPPGLVYHAAEHPECGDDGDREPKRLERPKYWPKRLERQTVNDDSGNEERDVAS